MAFASPIWLLALLPWAALVLWAMRGRRHKVRVPFLELWRGPVTGPPPKRSLHLPPPAMALLLAAILLGLLAAARPVLTSHTAGGPRVTIVVDHGLTISAQGRLRRAIDAADGPILQEFGEGPTELVVVPEGDVIQTTRAGWAARAASLKPTTMRSGPALAAAVADRLAATDGPVIVLSDQPLGGITGGTPVPPRLVQVPPPAASNVGLVRLAARISPRPQVMVRVRNQSDRRKATLASTRPAATMAMDLPPRDREADYFLDLPAEPEEVIEVSIQGADDDLAADNFARLVRQSARPRLEARSPLPPALQRVVEVYTRRRPPSPGAAPLAIVTRSEELPADGPAIVVAAHTSTSPPATAPDLLVRPHPLSEGMDFSVAATDPATQPPPDWTPLVLRGRQVLLAIRTDAPRRAWVALGGEGFARSPDFVVFWSRLFDWLGGEGQYVPDPGNTIDVHFPPPIDGAWRRQLADLAAALPLAGTPLAGPVLILASVTILVAALAARRRVPSPLGRGSG